MARKNNTLTDLQNFLSENPNEIEFAGNAGSREDFIKREPNSLVDVPQAGAIEEDFRDMGNVRLKDIANHLHTRAKREDKSFAEIWMELLKEASKQDPLLENTSLFQALRSLRTNSTSVISDGIAHIMKNRRR